jgi:hypothetical protein
MNVPSIAPGQSAYLNNRMSPLYYSFVNETMARSISAFKSVLCGEFFA